MKAMRTKTAACLVVALVAFHLDLQTAAGQGSAFTYQAQLNENASAANGNYDFLFTLYDDGLAGSIVGSPQTNDGVAVSGGLFTAQLDFGDAPWNGQSLWLEISVRTNGGGAFSSLTPRQPMTSVPYAIQSLNSATASSADSVAATNLSGTIPNSALPANPVFSGQVTAGSYSGSGAGLLNLNPANLNPGTASNITLVNPTLVGQAGSVAFIGDSMTAWTNSIASPFDWPDILLGMPLWSGVGWANDYAINGVTFGEMQSQISQALEEMPTNGPRTMTLMGLWNDVASHHSFSQITNDLLGCWNMMTNAGVPFVQIIPWEDQYSVFSSDESNTWTSVTNFIVTNGGPYAALVQAGYIITNYSQTVDGLHANQTNLTLIALAVQRAYTPTSFYNLKTNSVGLTNVHAVTYLNQVASSDYMYWDGGVVMLGPFTGLSYIWSGGGSPATPSFSGNYFQVNNSIGVGETADGVQGDIRWTGTASGDGSGLTNLSASQLVEGTVPIARLSGITSNQLDPETWRAATSSNRKALTEIAELNQRLNDKDAEIKELKERVERIVILERKLNELEATVNARSDRNRDAVP